jgi:hypothetical protein
LLRKLNLCTSKVRVPKVQLGKHCAIAKSLYGFNVRMTSERGSYKAGISSHLKEYDALLAFFLYSTNIHAILDHSPFVQYPTYNSIEQLHHCRCYQRPCASLFLCPRAFLHSRLRISCISCISQSLALLIVRFSYQ